MAARDRILDAAAQIMRSEGLTHATTKEIARVAGCSEALLYKHFADKTRLFAAVLQERAPALVDLLASLPERAGTSTVRENLLEVVAAARAFYLETFPMAAGLFADRELLTAHRARLAEIGAGPEHVNVAVADYLRRERDLGRVRAGVDESAAATLLLGACLQEAFLTRFWGRETIDTDPAALVGAACDGLLVE